MTRRLKSDLCRFSTEAASTRSALRLTVLATVVLQRRVASHHTLWIPSIRQSRRLRHKTETLAKSAREQVVVASSALSAMRAATLLSFHTSGKLQGHTTAGGA